MAQLLFGPGNSVTFGSLNGSGLGSSKSFAKTSLSNMAVGDLLVMWFGSQDNSTTSVITPPAGWTRYGAPEGSPSYSTSRRSGIFYYPLRTQADVDNFPATSTWTFDATAANARGGFVVARAVGIDLNNIEDSAATAFSGGSNATSLSVTGITTQNTYTLLVGGVYQHNSVGITVPTATSFMTGFDQYNSTAVGSTAYANTAAIMGYKDLSASGATGNQTATFNSLCTALGGELVAFKALPPSSYVRPTVIAGSVLTATASSGTTFTINKPTGAEDGDLLVVAISAQSATSTTDFTSSGWMRVSADYVPTSATYRITGFYALPVPIAANLTSTSFTFTSTDPAGGRIAASIFIVRHADLTHITAGKPSMAGTASSATITQTMGTPMANMSLLLSVYNGQFTVGNSYAVSTSPSGMALVSSTHVASANSTETPNVVYCQDVEAVSQGTRSLTWASVPAQTSVASVYIRNLSQPDAVTEPTGAIIKYTSAPDTLSDAVVRYTSAVDTLAIPKEVRPFPTGYASVTDMLSKTMFYCAHRGGSREWPEMSLYAYTQAGFWGVGALEVSLARTSDGVWFGLHDADINRTSGTTGLPNASAMTWAQVQSYQILGSTAFNNPAQANQPYMRWEEIVATYYSTHVLFVDIKYAGSYIAEFMTMINALPGNPKERIVGKSYGVGSSFSDTMRAAGYKTWGYYYETDFTPTNNMATYQSHYDILGMDYNASQATWDAVLAFGKPVMAHILPTSASYTTVQTKVNATSPGANAANWKGCMVSGVMSVIPRTP